MTVNQLVTRIKENNEDFEWYPTTQEIVNALQKHIEKISEKPYRTEWSYNGKVLDIGCGNGSFFEKFCNKKEFKNVQKFGIEKSNVLAEQLPEDVILLGSDFHEQTLIDKKVDMIFCNPPYTQYDEWAEKIILQGNAENIALVIPVRWRNSERLKEALERRKYKADIIGTYDFNNAERKARATVDLIFISAMERKYNGYNYDEKIVDPFDLWFDETFKINADKTKQYDYSYKEHIEKNVKNEIIAHGDTAEMLVQFYNKDMEHLYNNYRKLEELDADLLKELKVDIPSLKTSLKERLQGLKHIYWDLLFKKYDKMTSRLTSTGRNKVINRLNDNTAIDFTLHNIVQLTLWIIRHSNTLFEEQITEYFYSLCNSESIYRYKSNKRWNEDDWRYIKETFEKKEHFYRNEREERLKKATHFQLDYRIVVKAWSNFDTSWYSPKMTDSCRDFLSDTFIIAKNLGFDVDFSLPDKYANIYLPDWSNFDVKTTDGKLFANVKLYKNGNRHIKFCKEFMQKLNVEMARINNWVQDKTEAMAEMDIPANIINQVWGSNLQIGISDGRKLLGLPEA
jgi:SAM-dependent methyltransferase